MQYRGEKLNNRRGLTLVELMVVIGVIVILALIGSLTYMNVRQSQSNSVRASKVATIAAALEKYGREHGEYPSVASLNSTNTIDQVKQKLDLTSTDTLTFPGITNPTTSPIITSTDTLTPRTVVYDATSADPSQCTTDPTGYCDSFELRYQDEGSDKITTIKSTKDFANLAADGGTTGTPDTPNITATGLSSSSIRVSWPNTSGADKYEVRYGTSSSSISTNACVPTTQLSCTITGLNSATKYYVSVVAINNRGGPGAPDTADATTKPATPNMTATAVSETSIQLSWNTISGASSYTVKSGTSSSNVTAVQSACSSTTSCAISSLTPNTTYYFSIVANGAGGASATGTANAKTMVPLAPVPTALAVSYSGTTNTSKTWSWAATCNSYSTAEYEYTPTGGTATITSATSYTMNTSIQGNKYDVDVRARCKNVRGASGWSTQKGAEYWRPVETTTFITSGLAKLRVADEASPAGSSYSIWGYADIGSFTACPTGTYFTQSVGFSIDNSSPGYSAYSTKGDVWYTTNITAGHGLEFKFNSRCQNSATGAVSSAGYSDIFGNLNVRETRDGSHVGRWYRTCGGAVVGSDHPYSGRGDLDTISCTPYGAYNDLRPFKPLP